jgi:hypothetical protein
MKPFHGTEDGHPDITRKPWQLSTRPRQEPVPFQPLKVSLVIDVATPAVRQQQSACGRSEKAFQSS